MNNPGGLKPEEVLKNFDEIIKGIESPQGTKDAQQRLFPMFNEWIATIMTTPGKKQVFVQEALEMLRKPTSIAQGKDFSGVKGMSIDEAQTVELIDQAVRVGIISPELADELRKKENLTFFNILWMLVRDLFWVPVVAGAQSFGKEALKTAAK
jgi:hypothetical protein